MDGVHSGRFTGSRRSSSGALFPGDCRAPTQAPVKKQAVKRHHHKHNLKHRYEFLETLGKGTYGKVKKARERSARLVSRTRRTDGFYRCCPPYTGTGWNASSATKVRLLRGLSSGHLTNIHLVI